MNDAMKRFEELLRTDETLRKKLQEALQSYTGEQTEEAVFEEILVPLAADYDITATFDEFKEYIAVIEDRELNVNEITMVAGGSSAKGGGANFCLAIGVGGGTTWMDDDKSSGGNVCLAIGIGSGGQACVGPGAGFA